MSQIERPYLDFETHAPSLAFAPRRAHSSFAAQEAAPPPVPIRDADPLEILRVVATAYSIVVDDLAGKDRHRNVREARLVAYWMLRTRTKLSFPEIGRLLKKDHTSVMSGVRKCVAMRQEDASFNAFTETLAAAVDSRIKGGVAA